MAQTKAKHRVKMVVELEFGYHDEVSFTDKERLATKAELVKELTKELKRDGISQFTRTCDHNLKTNLKSIAFTKFDKRRA